MSETVFESAFERGIERYANLLFCEGPEKAVAACLREHPDPTEAYMRLLDLDTRAKRARIWHSKHTPCWCQPLPIRDDEQENILCSGYFHRHLVAYYSYSLRAQGFNYLKHPSFVRYSSGLLADPDCPTDLQDNAELMLDFPPQRLPGLVGIYWSPVLSPAPLSKELPPELKGRMGKGRSREELINS